MLSRSELLKAIDVTRQRILCFSFFGAMLFFVVMITFGVSGLMPMTPSLRNPSIPGILLYLIEFPQFIGCWVILFTQSRYGFIMFGILSAVSLGIISVNFYLAMDFLVVGGGTSLGNLTGDIGRILVPLTASLFIGVQILTFIFTLVMIVHRETLHKKRPSDYGQIKGERPPDSRLVRLEPREK